MGDLVLWKLKGWGSPGRSVAHNGCTTSMVPAVSVWPKGSVSILVQAGYSVLCPRKFPKSPPTALPRVTRAGGSPTIWWSSDCCRGEGGGEASSPVLSAWLQAPQGLTSARLLLFSFCVPQLLPMGSLTDPGSLSSAFHFDHDHSPVTLIFFLWRTGIWCH